MAEAPSHVQAPTTLEGWYVLHDSWRLDWPRWRALTLTERQHRVEELFAWLALRTSGDTAVYAVVGQKADILFLHYRKSVTELQATSAALARLGLFEELSPAGSFLSVIELAAAEGATRGDAEQRLWRSIPTHPHLCSYPMSKRRGAGDNWYSLTLEERRGFMRGHGLIGREFAGQVTQVVSGAIGLDDWEWNVDLHADDPLAFKKLVTAMRYDPASARFADFGPFTIGIRQDQEALGRWLLA